MAEPVRGRAPVVLLQREPLPPASVSPRNMWAEPIHRVPLKVCLSREERFVGWDERPGNLEAAGRRVARSDRCITGTAPPLQLSRTCCLL